MMTKSEVLASRRLEMQTGGPGEPCFHGSGWTPTAEERELQQDILYAKKEQVRRYDSPSEKIAVYHQQKLKHEEAMKGNGVFRYHFGNDGRMYISIRR